MKVISIAGRPSITLNDVTYFEGNQTILVKYTIDRLQLTGLQLRIRITRQKDQVQTVEHYAFSNTTQQTILFLMNKAVINGVPLVGKLIFEAKVVAVYKQSEWSNKRIVILSK